MRFPRTGWQSNARRAPTGYGNQTNLFVPALKRAGFEIDIFAFYGAEGAPMVDEDGVLTLPRLNDGYGNDIVKAHAAYRKWELLITLIDPFVLSTAVYGTLPWCAWTPIDSEPARPENVQVLKSARWIWAMSRFGETQLKNAGFEPMYVPHGVDTEIYKPGDRDESRAKLGKAIGADLTGKFVVAMNSANKGVPSRKGFGEAIEAFKKFSDGCPEAVLYLHTDMEGMIYGEHIPTIMEAVRLDPAKVFFAPQYPYNMGMLSAKYLNDVYNAADVFLQTSHGEGFGIPIVEAQAAGCPVIVTDFSAMTELCFAGWLVDGHRFWVGPGMQQVIPDVEDIKSFLHLSHAYQIGDYMGAMRNNARQGALAYDYRRVMSEYMLPALERIAADIDTGADKQAQRRKMREVVRARIA